MGKRCRKASMRPRMARRRAQIHASSPDAWGLAVRAGMLAKACPRASTPLALGASGAAWVVAAMGIGR